MNQSPIKIIQKVHWAIIIPVVAFGLYVSYINSVDPTGTLTEQNMIFLYLPPILLLISFPVSSLLFKNSLKEVTDKTNFKAKLSAFQTGHLIKMSIFELVGLAATVVSIITATYYNMAVLAIVLGVFIVNHPTIFKIESALNLDANEREKLMS